LAAVVRVMRRVLLLLSPSSGIGGVWRGQDYPLRSGGCLGALKILRFRNTSQVKYIDLSPVKSQWQHSKLTSVALPPLVYGSWNSEVQHNFTVCGGKDNMYGACNDTWCKTNNEQPDTDGFVCAKKGPEPEPEPEPEPDPCSECTAKKQCVSPKGCTSLATDKKACEEHGLTWCGIAPEPEPEPEPEPSTSTPSGPPPPTPCKEYDPCWYPSSGSPTGSGAPAAPVAGMGLLLTLSVLAWV